MLNIVSAEKEPAEPVVHEVEKVNVERSTEYAVVSYLFLPYYF